MNIDYRILVARLKLRAYDFGLTDEGSAIQVVKYGWMPEASAGSQIRSKIRSAFGLPYRSTLYLWILSAQQKVFGRLVADGRVLLEEGRQ